MSYFASFFIQTFLHDNCSLNVLFSLVFKSLSKLFQILVPLHANVR